MRLIVAKAPANGIRQMLLVAVVHILSCSAAFSNDANVRPKVRNVTPDSIPVIILPQRNDRQTGAKSNETEPQISGSAVTATITEDGIVLADGKVVKFVGTLAIPNDALCENTQGVRWACGLRAYVALRNFVHGKEIRCETLQTEAGVSISRCFRERTNLSEWMLAEGWATYDGAANDETLSRLAEGARKQGRGIWANGSRPLMPAAAPTKR